MSLSQKNITILLCILFFVLNSVWSIPGSLAIRYVVLYTALIATALLMTKVQLPKLTINQYLPVLCLVGLFIWVGFHRLMITTSPEIMSIEIKTIWKRSLLEAILGMGLGIALGLKTYKFNKNIFTMLLLGPVGAFYLSHGLDLIDPGANYWHYLEMEKNYIPKYQFVLFAMIAFAWIVFYLDREIRSMTFVKIIGLITALLLIANAIFLVNGKNGFLYMGLILMVCIARLFWKNVHNLRILSVVILLFLGTLFLGFQHVKTNPVWSNLLSDIEVARHTDETQIWKNYLPEKLENFKNSSGNRVSETTYVRTAWMIEGIQLVPKYPLGHGLIQDSFKYIGKKEWPDSTLSHTHSGWLDITLGLGIPGFLLILVAMVALIKKGIESENIYAKSAIWVLPTIFLAFFTSELSEKISFEVLIFYIALYSGATLKCQPKPLENLH